MSAPQRFRKKPVEIEAMLLDAGTGDKLDGLSANDMAHASIAGWMLDHGFSDFRVGGDHRPFGLIIKTLEGEMRADPGDWIIRGVQGEFYPCKPDIFEQTYTDTEPRLTEVLNEHGEFRYSPGTVVVKLAHEGGNTLRGPIDAVLSTHLAKGWRLASVEVEPT